MAFAYWRRVLVATCATTRLVIEEGPEEVLGALPVGLLCLASFEVNVAHYR